MQRIKPVTKPTKQRKRLYQAPDHIRHKFFAAPLSKDLKTSQGTNALPVRSGDTVRVMRGDHKGFEGKITRLDPKKNKIFVEGLTREKVDGTAVFVPIHPSKVMITRLNLDDKWRKKILERRKAARRKIEGAKEIVEKPAEVAEVKEVMEEKIVAEEKLVGMKPKGGKRKAARKPVAVKVEKKAEKKAKEAGKEEKPKPKKTRAKRKTAKPAEKTEGGA